MILVALGGALIALIAAIGATVIMIAVVCGSALGIGGAIVKTIKDKKNEKGKK